MKSLADLLVLLLRDCGGKCGVDVTRDVETLRSRVAHEGMSFITITLANYAKDFDQALDAGRVAPGLFASFGRLKSGIPEYLRGFLHHVFDPSTGELLTDASIECVRSIRQLSRFGVKVKLACSPERVEKALDAYVAVDRACGSFYQDRPSYCREDSASDGLAEPPWRRTQLGYYYKGVAAILIEAMLAEDEDGDVQVRCAHGPGATVERYTPNGKWALGYWHHRLEKAGLTWFVACFGAEKPLWGDDRIGFQPVHVDPADERPAKVVLVPKTLQSPRVIAVEPCAMQFAQQGLAAVLKRAIDRCPLTSGRINFRDQTVNQAKALSGSVSGHWATIDLKDASDRVGCDLVQLMFWAAPKKFWDLLWASRSMRAKLPDGREVDLRKFASMGSAMCFPVESLVFYTIAIAARLQAHGLPCTSDTVNTVASGVYVYGDDICCPADETPMIVDALETFGLLVNRRKSFWNGRFRESCGVDAFRGELVTPVYLRTLLPDDHAEASGLVSTVATANQLATSGYMRTANALRKSVEHLLGRLPQVPENSPALGWTWFSGYVPPKRWNRRLQRVETRCWMPEPVKRDDPLEGDGAWAKCARRIGMGTLSSFLSRGGTPRTRWTGFSVRAGDDDHLKATARPYVLTLKRRWAEV